MGNQKRKSSDIEKEFVAMNDGNGEDTDSESPPGFSLSELPIYGHPNQRNVARSSMEKGKSKMVATPGKLPQHVVVQSTVAKALILLGYKICTFTKPTTLVPIHESIKKKLATSAREGLGRKFHEECYYDFKAFVASSLTKFSTSFVVDIFGAIHGA
ncbi:hypothetical protein AAG906_022456 [Vitis piasezkii]